MVLLVFLSNFAKTSDLTKPKTLLYGNSTYSIGLFINCHNSNGNIFIYECHFGTNSNYNGETYVI